MVRALLLLALVALGGWQLGEGVWIHAKGSLAQWLVARAWSETLEGRREVRPWPWADTWPVARLTAPGHGVEWIVLEGDSGRTLAFGPGRTPGSARPGEAGTTVISGHRDTHFRFLQEVAAGDRIELEGAGGAQRYRVTSARVLDTERHQLVDDVEGHRLLLVTCFPFNALAPGGPLRYVVAAEPDR